nr:hypothetical protein [Saprospiraceae bacterium]
ASLSGGKGVVVMVNSERYDIIPEIVRSVANAYDWEGYNQIPLKSLSDSERNLDAYVGRYQHFEKPERFVEIKKVGNHLEAAEKGVWSAEMIQADVTFFYLDNINPTTSITFEGTGGVIRSFTAEQGETKSIWNKVK